MHVAAARFTPASLIAAATRASAPASFLISMIRSYGIAIALFQIVDACRWGDLHP